jgi:hypothetical protein
MVNATGRIFPLYPTLKNLSIRTKRSLRPELHRLLTVIAMAVAAETAAAQPKISPLLERWGGSAYVVVFRPGVEMTQARDRLRERGFDLIEHPDMRPQDLLAAGPRVRLGRLSEWDDVAYVLPASPALVSRQHVIACAGPLVAEGGVGDYVATGRGWPSTQGARAEVRYAFESVTGRIEQGAARAEIERGLREWEKHANLTLTASADAGEVRTIAIRFADRGHGDAYPFDGPAGSLAHTFFPAPPNSETLAGDMHFDAAENWQIGATVDLYSVAVHEAGHALGLGHSDQPGAVMYPYYHQAYGLHSDDIAGIQALYGPRDVVVAPPPPTPIAPPEPPPVAPPPPLPPPVPSKDKSAPTLRIASPSRNNVTTSAAVLTISGSASDDTGVAAVRWTTSTGDSGVAVGAANWTASVPLLVGTTVITVRAYDASANSAWRAITVTRR